jgi:ABC-type xylose transport system permease subunit
VPLGTFLLCAAIIIVFTPIQAAAEEFAFRGLAAQMFGSWIRFVPVPIVLSSILFAAAHTQYIGWATLDVSVFALVAGYVTWRTGGLEAGIALHSANNTLAFLTLASGIGGVTATDPQSSGDPWSLLVTVVTMGIFVFVIERLVRRRGLATRLEPIAQAPATLEPTDPDGAASASAGNS